LREALRLSEITYRHVQCLELWTVLWYSRGRVRCSLLDVRLHFANDTNVDTDMYGIGKHVL